MSDEIAIIAEPLEQPPVRGFPKIAWTVIAVLVTLAILVQRREPAEEPGDGPASLQQNVLEIQGKYLVASAQLPGMERKELYDNAQPLNTGPLSARLRFVVLAGELQGPHEAVAILEKVQETASGEAADPQSLRVTAALCSMYADYEQGKWDAPSLGAEERDLLTTELGWFGALALAPDAGTSEPNRDAEELTAPETPSGARKKVLAEAWQAFTRVVIGFVGVFALGAAGFGGAVLFLALIASGKVRSSLRVDSSLASIYAETFAVWMLWFTLLTLIASLLAVQWREYQLIISSAASLLSLAALAWPLLRGVPWSRVREDVGLYVGTGPLRELLWGVVCYVANLPVVVMGFIMMLTLLGIRNALTGGEGLDPGAAPSHPIIEWVQTAGWTGRLHIALLACVVAPIVEEIVFRGVLYQHLRGVTVRWRTSVSVLLSTFVNSFIFAVIHPQGLLAAPALGAVAVGLSLAREWRGSLLAPMALHATNNGMMMLLLFSLI